MKMMNEKQTVLTGSIWLDKSEQRFLGQKRVELLRQIAVTGSITHAAKAVNLSYKAAWDAVSAMNNMAD